MREKFETWKELIQSEKLRDALENIQMNIRVQPDSKLNENIFKLLLNLCHIADKCRTADKPNCETGKEIAELTKLLCSLLINVPDDNKFVKVLFKIVHCLISLNLYKDAAEVCCYLQPGNLYHPQAETMNLLTKVLSLWHTTANNMYQAFSNKSLNTENYNNLKSIIKYEIKIIQIVYKNYTKQLISTISSHIDKITLVDKEKKYFHDFYKHILEYLKETQLYLDKDEKYIIYCHILRILCHIIRRTIDMTNIRCTMKIFDELSNYFNVLLIEDEECYQCFQQFQSFCTTLLVPMENLVNNNAKNMQDVVSCQLNLAQKYGNAESLRWNALILGEIIEPIFQYWETCIETDEHVLKQLLDTEILFESMNLFLHIDTDEFYIKRMSIECKWCLDKMCTVNRDLYNAIIMKCKCINLLCKYHVKNMPKKVCVLARKILEQNVKRIMREMEEYKCNRWIRLWNTCRTLILNMSILSEHIYEESIHLYSLLCVSIFQFQEIESNFEDFENIVSTALSKLSVMHYKNNTYREAMTASALNALLTYDQPNTKAFLAWTTIKKQVSKKVAQLTMLDCLKNDRDKIKNELGLSIDMSKYDLVKLCLREAKSLLEGNISFTNGVSAVLDKLKKLKPSNCQYAHVAQLLGYYLLGFEYDSSILKYQEQIISDLKQNKLNSVALLCLEANLYFFIFVEELRAMTKQTQMEMENTKFALCAPKIPELVETKSPNIIPSYTMINIKKASSLVLNLQKCLQKWKQLFNRDINEIVKNWEPTLVLRILITAGEYSRLYRYEDCEAEAWMLAYKLASKIDDYRTIIYVTGRCISLRQIDYNWIAIAKEYAIKHRDSKDENVTGAIAMFWISLADLYFECGKYDDAKQLVTEAKSLPEISFFGNKSVYLLSLDVIIRNSSLYKDNMQHEDYGSYIVETLFTSRCLNQDLLTEKHENQADYLFSFDVVFTTAVNLSIRINSLLSFRGISPDLVLHLKSAQSLGAVLRVAELLKSLCYIDLSRSKLNDCEVKLQGLEHMLGIETFQSSINVEPVKQTSPYLAVTPTRIVNDPIRDTLQHGSSPILGKKVFDLPTFTLHTNCDCHICGNVSYQYLVFVATYIRAQLYALQNQVTIALEHFYGAFEIRQRLFKEEESALPENWPDNEIGVKRFSWQARFYIIDYIHLLIDFCYFLKTNVTSKQQNAFDIANLTIDICHRYKLEGHPIYMSAKELALDNDFQPILESSGCLKFTVPQPHDIDITRYTRARINSSDVCVTPSVQNHPKKPLSIRRKRSPIALKIAKININWSDDEDDDSLSPPLTTRLTRKSKFPGAKLVTRKILEDLSDNDNSDIQVSKKTESEHDLNGDGNNTQKKSIKDIMIKVAPLVPDISETLMDLIEKSDVSATNIDELIEKVESLKINSSRMPRTKNFKDKTKLTIVDYNKNVDRTIELLKNVTTNENIDSFMSTKVDKQIQNQKTPHEKKFFKTGLLKEYKESAKLHPNNEIYNTRMTRSSLRRRIEEKL
ncbi:uncharacterized protein LOC126854970 isoform X1 [Cataglyphis hispanica]|uniref:uncharacterized protein LOC126854970 isoform X1 n=1 Tax=Cataglyphis hispanica TaxID=1086592 RepID=UPI00217FAE92|nr:uncharacterized protein LOC126854970 isoform X1 [Cataglyphis hispanica]